MTVFSFHSKNKNVCDKNNIIINNSNYIETSKIVFIVMKFDQKFNFQSLIQPLEGETAVTLNNNKPLELFYIQNTFFLRNNNNMYLLKKLFKRSKIA